MSEDAAANEDRLELSERQRERFERIRGECSDEYLPEPTDGQILKALMDTWDAVDDGHYSDGNPVLKARVRKLEERDSDKTGAISAALDALRDSGPAFHRIKNAERYLKPFEVREDGDGGLRADGGFDMSVGLAFYLRNLADKVESGELCNGEVWERLYADGPAGPVEYEAGPSDATGHESTEVDR